jgi:HPt (histidine-containing phosphotransfer) domain-containing protein
MQSDNRDTPHDMTEEESISADLLNRERVEMLRDLDGGAGEMLGEIIDMFLEEIPPRIEALAAAVEAGDPEETHRAAHGIKGSAYNMGAQRAGDIAQIMETRGRAGSMDNADALCTDLQTAYDETAKALKAEVGRA